MLPWYAMPAPAGRCVLGWFTKIKPSPTERCLSLSLLMLGGTYLRLYLHRWRQQVLDKDGARLPTSQLGESLVHNYEHADTFGWRDLRQQPQSGPSNSSASLLPSSRNCRTPRCSQRFSWCCRPCSAKALLHEFLCKGAHQFTAFRRHLFERLAYILCAELLPCRHDVVNNRL